MAEDGEHALAGGGVARPEGELPAQPPRAQGLERREHAHLPEVPVLDELSDVGFGQRPLVVVPGHDHDQARAVAPQVVAEPVRHLRRVLADVRRHDDADLRAPVSLP